jgi:hypothetical protein
VILLLMKYPLMIKLKLEDDSKVLIK